VLKLRGLVWASVLALGLLHLFYPLFGDQALFLLYAEGLHRGGLLYVDLWDNKQPGIFWFFLLAGKLFGFDAVSVHLFELLWVCLAAALLTVAAHRSFASRRVAELTPLFTAGLYYWCASPWLQTQLEILVSLPLAVCVLASLVALRRPALARRMHFLFGLMAVVVATFKLVLLLVPVAMWLVLVWFQRPAAREAVFGMLPPALLGAALLASLVALHFRVSGNWDAFVWTNFVYPRLALQEIPRKPLIQLLEGSAWWIRTALPALPLAWWAIRDRRREPVRLVEAQALAWLLAGWVAIAVQKFSWWPYHFLLLVFPLGLLVVSAIDRFAIRRRPNPVSAPVAALRLRWVVLLTAGAMFALSSRQGPLGLRAAAAALAAPSGERLATFQQSIDPLHQHRIDATAFLRAEADTTQAIHVFGDPNWYLAADRPQAMPIHGWSWQFFLASQWRALPDELSRTKPAYLFVDPYFARLIAERSPATWRMIQVDYLPLTNEAIDGTWYRLRQVPAP